MKFSQLHVLVWGLLFLIGPPLSANSSVMKNDQSRPLVEILEEMSTQYQVFFSYEIEVMKEIKVDFHVEKDEDLDTAIDRLLDLVDLQYKAIGEKYYVIHKKGKKGRKSMKKYKENYGRSKN